MQQNLVTWAAKLERKNHRVPPALSLDSITAEIVGSRFMPKLGIGAPSEIRVLNERSDATADWIVKSFEDGRLKAGVGGSGLRVAIKKIPGAISLTALRNKFGVSGKALAWDVPSPNPLQSLFSIIVSDRVYAAGISGWLSDAFLESVQIDEKLLTDDVLCRNVNAFLYHGRDQSPEGFLSDFVPPEDWTPIRNAVAADSEQMLLIHAARVFLACTTAHAGNILVDASGKLYSIDHERCELTDGREIDLLAENVKLGTRAHESLRVISASLDTAIVRGLFDILPEQVTWPMGPRDRTVTHYLSRLEKWKKCFPCYDDDRDWKSGSGVSHADRERTGVQ
jgi:hypothetical protein